MKRAPKWSFYNFWNCIKFFIIFTSIIFAFCMWTLQILVVLAAGAFNTKSYSVTSTRSNFIWVSSIYQFLISFAAVLSIFICKRMVLGTCALWKRIVTIILQMNTSNTDIFPMNNSPYGLFAIWTICRLTKFMSSSSKYKLEKIDKIIPYL